MAVVFDGWQKTVLTAGQPTVLPRARWLVRDQMKETSVASTSVFLLRRNAEIRCTERSFEPVTAHINILMSNGDFFHTHTTSSVLSLLFVCYY